MGEGNSATALIRVLGELVEEMPEGSPLQQVLRGFQPDPLVEMLVSDPSALSKMTREKGA